MCLFRVEYLARIATVTNLYIISDLEEVEEGPDEGYNEAGDDDEKEEVVVAEPEERLAGQIVADGGGRAGHADHSKHLNHTK